MAVERFDNSAIENIDIGGAEVYVGGEYLGLTRGDCSASWETETVDVWQGVPRRKIGSIIRQRNGQVSMEVLELTPENYQLASGDGELVPVDNTSTETVAAEAVTLTGTTAVALKNADVTANTITVKDSEGSTTYVLDTDYTVTTDATTKITSIARKSTGSITDGQSVKVAYSYTAHDITTHLLFGSSSALNEIRNMVIHKHNDRNGKDLIIQIWKLQSSGALNFVFNEEASDVLGINLEFGINDDSTNHPTCPMALISWANSFDIDNLPAAPAGS